MQTNARHARFSTANDTAEISSSHRLLLQLALPALLNLWILLLALHHRLANYLGPGPLVRWSAGPSVHLHLLCIVHALFVLNCIELYWIVLVCLKDLEGLLTARTEFVRPRLSSSSPVGPGYGVCPRSHAGDWLHATCPKKVKPEANVANHSAKTPGTWPPSSSWAVSGLQLQACCFPLFSGGTKQETKRSATDLQRSATISAAPPWPILNWRLTSWRKAHNSWRVNGSCGIAVV